MSFFLLVLLNIRTTRGLACEIHTNIEFLKREKNWTGSKRIEPDLSFETNETICFNFFLTFSKAF